MDEDLTRLRRFLYTGSEMQYQVGSLEKREGLVEGRDGIPRILDTLLQNGRGEDVIKEVLAFPSHANIAPPLIVLAICARSTNPQTKKAAFSAVSEICKTPAHLFSFIQFLKRTAESKSGWGRALRRAVSDWYNKKDPMDLAVLTTRYKSSAGWTHLDVLRLSHTKPDKPGTVMVVKYLLRGLAAAKEGAGEGTDRVLQYLEAVDTVKHSADEQQVAALVRRHNLSKEHIPTKLLNSAEVWRALLEKMSVREVLTNIGKIASLNLLDPGTPSLPGVLATLQNEQAIVTHKISPVLVLASLRSYEQEKGKGKWVKNEQVVNALNRAFSVAVTKNSVGSNKKVLVGVKISSSSLHRNSVRGTVALNPVAAVAGLVHTLLRTEAECTVVYFLSDVRPLTVNKKMTFPDICKEIEKASVPLPPQMCQCDMTSPLTWAEEKGRKYDTIVIVTDSKESTGELSMPRAIEKYRQKFSLQTRLAVCALTANQVNLADPSDHGSLDIAGFDCTVPEVLNLFSAGKI